MLFFENNFLKKPINKPMQPIVAELQTKVYGATEGQNV